MAAMKFAHIVESEARLGNTAGTTSNCTLGLLLLHGSD